MKIHSNLPEHEFINALNDARRAAGVYFERHNLVGSRSHERAIDVILEGESGRHMNSGSYGARTDTESASWDQWGIFLAVLYEADPTILCGSAKYPNYRDAEDFHYRTTGRFDRAELLGDDATVTTRDSADYKVTSHRWAYSYEKSHPFSGQAVLYCKGHGPKNKRRECSAMLARG